MKIKTSELTGAALDWAVTKCEGRREPEVVNNFAVAWYTWGNTHYSTDWAQGGPIIERVNISVIRLDDKDIPDANGFWTGKTVPQWGAVRGDRHSLEENHGSQGDYWGVSYHVNEAVVCGPTLLVAAMRCYVTSMLGNELDIPEELL